MNRMRWRLTTVLATVVASTMACSGPAEEGTPSLTVKTERGTLRGVAETGVRVFRGIPYAAPPTGDLRWRAPRPASAWDGVRVADAFGPPCPQPGLSEAMTEDCLTLNVWAPVTPPPAEGWPVMVWIHGGGYRTGTGADPNTSGEAFAHDGVVLVSLNYRLGALGFFAHPAIEAEARGEPGVDFGVLDMEAALGWVKRNIDAFDGDPTRVTIFGESAGGMSIHLLMVAPGSAGLFQRAIAMSGYGTWSLPRSASAPSEGVPGGGASAEEIAKGLVARAAPDLGSAPSAAQLRAIPAERLADAVGMLHLPIVDGRVVPEEPGIVFARGEQHDVPFIAGGNSYDGAVMAWAGLTAADVLEPWKVDQKRIRELYADDFAMSEELGAGRLFGESRYVMAGRTLARLMSRVSSPGYLYLFAFVPPNQRDELPGAPHGSEIRPLFGHAADADAAAMGRTMRAYFVAFARTGDPNGGERPRWPAYDGKADRWLVFDDEPEVREGVLAERLDFLEGRYRERVAAALGESATSAR